MGFSDYSGISLSRTTKCVSIVLKNIFWYKNCFLILKNSIKMFYLTKRKKIGYQKTAVLSKIMVDVKNIFFTLRGWNLTWNTQYFHTQGLLFCIIQKHHIISSNFWVTYHGTPRAFLNYKYILCSGFLLTKPTKLSCTIFFSKKLCFQMSMTM